VFSTDAFEWVNSTDFAARLGEIAGKPIELLGRALPETATKAVAVATTKALNAALAVALSTLLVANAQTGGGRETQVWGRSHQPATHRPR
jgi:hypothetical protein